MKTRGNLIKSVAAGVCLAAASALAADWHFAANGSDASDGLSPARALKTIERLNALDLKAGDRVLFRRGDLFRGAIKAKDGVTYAAYGAGSALPTPA